METSAARAVVLLSVSALAGCGGDPLLGKWSNTSSAQDTTTTNEIEFRADSTFTTHSVVTYAATASFLAGCVAETTYEGGTWSEGSSGGAMTLAFGGTATVTDSRSNCTDPINNRSASSVTQTLNSTGSYVIDGNTLTLTLTDSGAGGTRTSTYTKQ